MGNRDFIVGGVVQDDDYFFHQAYVGEMWDLLKKNNIILLSPRRTGKTSLMYRLIAEPQHNYKVVHFNVETLSSASDFFIHLLNTLYELHPEYWQKLSKSWNFLKNLVAKVEEVGVMSCKVKLRQNANWEKDWEKLSEELMKKIALLDDKLLFIIDEFPDMLSKMLQKDKEEAATFLHHFRKIRLDLKSTNIRWLVSGSVNIRGVLDEASLINTINDFQTEFLPNIKKKEADDFICSMLNARGVEFNQAILQTIYNLLGEPMPYFVQLFTQEIYRYWRRETGNISEIDTNEVIEIFNKSLLGEVAHDKLQHYHSRIKLYYPEQLQSIAYEILDVLAKSNSGVSEKQLYSQYLQYQQDKGNYSQQNTANKIEMQRSFNALMLRLDSDFYTYKNEDNIYDFKTHLIKLWWNKNWTQL